MSEPTEIGPFKVLGQLGQGFFGEVYQAQDPTTGQAVAIKLCTYDQGGLRERFAREARDSSRLRHDNIAQVVSVDRDREGIPYLAEELLPGESLRRLVDRRAPLTPRTKIELLRQIARGLAYAHAHGVVHHGLQPSKIHVADDASCARIVDFGIARLEGGDTQITQDSVTLGTAGYLAPEQVRGGEIDHRADIFAFGVLIYELLTYERPFKGSSLSALVYQILYKVPAPMRTLWPECPEDLGELAKRCLEKKPEDRPASTEEVIRTLEGTIEEIEAGRLPALDALSPVPLPPEVTTAFPLVKPPATAPASAPSRPAPPTPAPAPTEGLAERAHQISSLVERGDFEAARRRLDETMADFLDGTLSPAARPASGSSPGRGIGRAVSAARRQLRAFHQRSRSHLAAVLARAPRDDVLARTVTALRLHRRQTALIATFLALAVTALALATAGWWILGSGDEPLDDVGAGSMERKPAGTGPPSRSIRQGRIRVMARPWAQLIEITDAEGFVQALPEETFTPLLLELPLGTYHLRLSHPDHAEVASVCEVEVLANRAVDCSLELERATVEDFLEETGWWP